MLNDPMPGFVLPKRWLSVVVGSLVAFAELSASGQRYNEIAADIEVFSIPETNSYSFSVVCTTSTNEWRIDPSFQEFGTTQWHFDGTNIYENIIAIGAPRSIKIRPSEVGPQSITNSSVHVMESRDGCPLGDARVLIPWLAFSSGTYLRRPNRLLPLPIVSSLRYTPDGFAYSDETKVFEDELGLPKSFSLFASESLFNASVTNGPFRGSRDVELWKRGSMGFKWDFPEGALRLRYSVTKSTNFMGWNIPLEFEMEMYEHRGGMIVAISGARGRVVSSRTSVRPSGVMAGQNVVDWRFRDSRKQVDAIIYPAVGDRVAPTNDSALQAIFAERVERAPGTQATQQLRARSVVLTFIILSAVVLFSIVAYRKR